MQRKQTSLSTTQGAYKDIYKSTRKSYKPLKTSDIFCNAVGKRIKTRSTFENCTGLCHSRKTETSVEKRRHHTEKRNKTDMRARVMSICIPPMRNERGRGRDTDEKEQARQRQRVDRAQ